MDDQEFAPIHRRWYQVRIATWFWGTACVACFFAGRFWSLPPPPPPAIAPAIGPPIQLAAGSTVVLTAAQEIPEMLVDNTTICRIRPIAPQEVRLEAVATGSARLTLHREDGSAVIYEVHVR